MYRIEMDIYIALFLNSLEWLPQNLGYTLRTITHLEKTKSRQNMYIILPEECDCFNNWSTFSSSSANSDIKSQ